jgi:hypothetical protein
VENRKLAKVNSCCFDFHCVSSYIMAGVVFLLVLGSIRELMLRDDDAQRGSEL